MTKLLVLAAAVAACGTSKPAAPPAVAKPAAPVGVATADALAGTWTGRIDVMGEPLAIAVAFDGRGGATISIPAQEAKDVPLTGVSIAGVAVHFELPSAGVVFDGTRAGDAIAGTMKQHGMALPFQLARGAPAVAHAPLSAADGAPLVGRWRGLARRGAKGRFVELDLAVRDGAIAGTGTAGGECRPAQPIAGISFAARRVQIELADGLGTVDATLDGDALVGGLTVGGDRRDLRLERVAAAPHDVPYRELEVAFDSTAPVRLAGTLALPAGVARPPVVVLVTGSGPQDRDECVAGVRPFRQLADHLARRGIATLRYDDRGTARSTGDFGAATAADFADDAAAAVKFLRARTDVDVRRIGILGHSEGGLIAPMVAARDPGIAFIVLWAGPGLPLADVVIAQSGDLVRADGGSPEDAEAARRIERVVFAALRDATDEADLAARLRKAGADLPGIGDVGAWAAEKAHESWRPWLRWYLDYDPRATLAKVRCPVLAINGALDMQVAAKPNLGAIRAALAGHRDVEIVELPGLNHLFQPTTTGAGSEYGTASTEIDAAVLDATSRWIAARAITKP